ncbi:MAG: hypothetical protein ACRDRH_04360 [Pseudonocardia sp.]
MPTFSRTPRFDQDLKKLTTQQRQRFEATVLTQFVDELKVGRFRSGVRVKRVQATVGVWEMTWALDERATFEYGPELQPEVPHVTWRRVGTHDTLQPPIAPPDCVTCRAGHSRAAAGAGLTGTR